MIHDFLRVIVLLVACFYASTSTYGTLVANDDASESAYDDGWATGDDGGSGFGDWTLQKDGSDSQSGFFVGASDINTADRSWGMYANDSKIANAYRPFDAALSVGQTFSLRMDNGAVQDGGSVGFGFQNASGENVWEFFLNGSNTTYSVNQSGGFSGTGVNETTGGLDIVFKLTSSTAYSVEITPIGSTTTTKTGNLLSPTGGTTITQLRLFNFNAGSGGGSDLFFNNLSAVPEPSAMLGVGMVGLLGSALAPLCSRLRKIRRRRDLSR